MNRTAIFLFLALLLLAPLRDAVAFHPFTPGYVRMSRVEDQAKLMHDNVRKELLELADDTEYATGAQMIIVTVPALPPNWRVDYYAQYAAQQFQMSAAKPGVMILVTKAEAQVGFAMAPGLASRLSKKILADIVKHEFAPELKKGDFQQALRNGTKGISAALTGNYKNPGEKRKQWLPFAVLLPIVVLLQVLFGDGNSGRFFGGGAWKRW